jgi:hypothetical protein
MTIKETKTSSFLFSIALIILFSCQGNKVPSAEINEEQHKEIDPRSLVVHHEDLSVLFALQSDSLYRVLEDSLVRFKGFTLNEAEQTIQALIDERSLMTPVISFYGDEGRESKELSYLSFKKYIAIVKDSVRGKKVKLDSSNFIFLEKDSMK